MKSLLIETSTEEGLSSIYSYKVPLFQSNIKGFQHSRTLMKEIDRGLKSTNLSISDLSFIAVGVGPGSYTGLRVGVMVAKTFSFATKVPIVAISSLEGIVPLVDGPFAAALDAKISGVYVLFGEKKGDQVHYRGPIEVLSLEALSECVQERIPIISPHAFQLEKKWKEKNLKEDAQFVEGVINPQYLIEKACARFENQEIANDRTLNIRYLREWQ